MKPGIYTNMPNAEYHAGQGISSSGLKLINKAPAAYKYASENPKPQTPAMMLGTAVHSMVLEPDKNEVMTAPAFNRRTKAGKAEAYAFEAEHSNKIILSPEQFALAVGMRDAVFENPYAKALFGSGVAERSHFWHDQDTGELCKVRTDWYNPDMELIVDLKTATFGDQDGFLRATVNFSYELSAMYYIEGLRATDTSCREFIFVVVENTPPHLVSLYILPEEMKQKGRVMWRRALDTYHQCRQTDTWPGYPDEIQVLQCPKWALNV